MAGAMNAGVRPLPDANNTGNNISDRTASEFWTLSGTVQGPLDRRETTALVEREQAMVADPVPLGLAGFASATLTISVVLAGWFRPGDVVIAIPVALVFGGIVQFLAGMWAFRRGNVLAATAFGAFGAFNVSWAILEWMTLAHLLPASNAGGSPAYVAGIFVLTFSLISFYLGYAALGDNLMIAAILMVLGFTYLADGVGIWLGGANWILSIGGYAGIIVSLMAFYLSAAIVVNSAHRRTAWPTFQRSWSMR
ncbi:MAG: acetate uptake transporter [Ktedonobacterales bacterium]